MIYNFIDESFKQCQKKLETDKDAKIYAIGLLATRKAKRYVNIYKKGDDYLLYDDELIERITIKNFQK